MKNQIRQPGFEALFSISIIAILCMPQLLLAQNHKEVNIAIRNNDTLYNGKNIKDLKGDDRREALAEIDKVTKPAPPFNDAVSATEKNGNVTSQVYTFRTDSLHNKVRTEVDRIVQEGFDRAPQVTYRVETNNRPGSDGLNFSTRRATPFAATTRRNTQNFTYTHTDDNGINTYTSYRVTEPGETTLKRIAGIDKATLSLTDLTLTPQFSAGTTTLMFSLPVKNTTTVKLTDSEGKTVWTATALTQTFSKTFSWPMNGVYYLLVKQGAQTAVKQIVKN